MRFSILWGERTRFLKARSSALSAVVRVGGRAGVNGQDLVLTLNRRNQTGAYQEDVVSTQLVKSGVWPVAVRLYTHPDGQGDVVGTADASVFILPDGTGISWIDTTGLIASLEIVQGQTVLVGEKKDLLFTARNASGQILAVTPGSGAFYQVTGFDVLELENRTTAKGLKPGSAGVFFTVDDIVSPTGTVAITSNATVQVEPSEREIAVNRTAGFTAAVANAPDASVTWTIEEGANGGTLSPADGNGVNYTAPATAGTYHLIATSQYDSAKKGTATITVIPAVTILPSPVTTTLRKQVQLTATVEGVPDSLVLWSVQEGAAGGTVDANGKYTAPATSGVYHVIATSRADSRAKATVTVTVQSGSGTIIIQ